MVRTSGSVLTANQEFAALEGMMKLAQDLREKTTAVNVAIIAGKSMAEIAPSKEAMEKAAIEYTETFREGLYTVLLEKSAPALAAVRHGLVRYATASIRETVENKRKVFRASCAFKDRAIDLRDFDKYATEKGKVIMPVTWNDTVERFTKEALVIHIRELYMKDDADYGEVIAAFQSEYCSKLSVNAQALVLQSNYSKKVEVAHLQEIINMVMPDCGIAVQKQHVNFINRHCSKHGKALYSETLVTSRGMEQLIFEVMSAAVNELTLDVEYKGKGGTAAK